VRQSLFFIQLNNQGGAAWFDNASLNLLTADVVAVPGDYNGNGVVDAADYVLWRKGGPLANEVDNPGTVNAADYTAWRARFGNTSGAASGAISASVPEPGTWISATFALLVTAGIMRRRS
jgi:hypothetical protein